MLEIPEVVFVPASESVNDQEEKLEGTQINEHHTYKVLRPTTCHVMYGRSRARARACARLSMQRLVAGLSRERRVAAVSIASEARCVCADGPLVIAGAADASLAAWAWREDGSAPQEVARQRSATAAPITSMAFGADERLLITGAEDGCIRTWDVLA